MKKSGFTFIELLVVTTIIILLTSIALVSYQAAERRARDDKRQADLEQFRSALEMIRSDVGYYPYNNNCLPPASGAWDCEGTTYMNEVPQDPKGYKYYYNSSDGSDYTLCARMETSNIQNGCSGDPDCGGKTCNYHVSSP